MLRPQTAPKAPLKIEFIKSKLDLNLVGLIKKSSPTPSVQVLCKPTRKAPPVPVSSSINISPHLDYVEEKINTVQNDVQLRDCPPIFDKSKRMCMYRGSFREIITSLRESTIIQGNISTLDEENDFELNDVRVPTADYPPIFVKSSKMCLYRGSFQDSSEINNIHWNISSSKNDTCEDICLECRDFSTVDKHAANFPRRNVFSIEILAGDLCNRFDSKVDKARAIFTWLHHNIAYDTKSFFGNNVKYQTPEETLKTGLSVCQGYVELFDRLAYHAGLEAVVVIGHGKGYGYKSSSYSSVTELKNHAWNAVKLDSMKWQLVDPCWGAGGVDNNHIFKKNFIGSAFTSSPETFRIKHFPSDPKYQFCATELSWEEYIMMKEPPILYNEFFDKGFSEVTIQPSGRFIKPEPTKFIITTKCVHTFIQPEDQYVLLLYVDGVHKPFDGNGTIWTCETSAIRKGSVVRVHLMETIGDRDGKGISVQEFLRLMKSNGHSWCYLCSWDVK